VTQPKKQPYRTPTTKAFMAKWFPTQPAPKDATKRKETPCPNPSPTRP
jgi:hypothetical protein